MPGAGDHLKQVTAGQPFRPSASWHNAVSEIVRQYGGRLTAQRVGGAASAGRPHSLPNSDTWVKIIGDHAASGKYTAYLARLGSTSATTISTSAAVNEAELFVVDTTVEVTAVNIAELGQSTHALTSGTPKVKYFRATRLPLPADDGSVAYLINGFDVELCA